MEIKKIKKKIKIKQKRKNIRKIKKFGNRM